MYSIEKLANMILLALFGCLLLSGCSSLVKTKSYPPGKIWVLPSPDAIVEQDGKKGTREGSGEVFGKYLADCFTAPFSTFWPEGNKDILSGVDSLSKLLSLAEKKGVDYLLLTSLGEFHQAKPGANRPDRGYLETAYLFDVKHATKVWELSLPLYVEKSNDDYEFEFIMSLMASYVANSIQGNATTNPGGR